MVKLCINCCHYRVTNMAMTDYCAHPELQKPADLVRGEQRLTYCDATRADAEKCGPAAIRWEAK